MYLWHTVYACFGSFGMVKSSLLTYALYIFKFCVVRSLKVYSANNIQVKGYRVTVMP